LPRKKIGKSESSFLKRAVKWVTSPNKDMELMMTGAHILSGAVIQTNALEELFPNWLENPPEPVTPAKKDRMRFLTQGSSIPIPAPPQMHNKGNHILSLNNLTKWLAEKAEELGVEVYPGFAASEVSLTPETPLTVGTV
jgi:electron-transferring-flavoprotein dehydrogenase